MSPPRFALVTPSYSLDHEVCCLAINSARRYLPPSVPHFVIVSQDDFALFRGLGNSRVQVLVQEELVQERFWRVPGLPRWRVSLKTLPVRGWIWQQLVKLSIANRIDAEAYAILDSDCFFIRPFDPQSLVVEGKIPLFREDREFYRTHRDTQRWSELSQRLLGLPTWKKPYGTGYVGPLRFWRRDVLLKLQAQLSRGGGRNAWLRRVARHVTFSEYALYGIYVEHLLGFEAAGHYPLDRNLTHEYWPESPMSPEELKHFGESVPADKSLVMINARARTPVPLIRAAFGF